MQQLLLPFTEEDERTAPVRPPAPVAQAPVEPAMEKPAAPERTITCWDCLGQMRWNKRRKEYVCIPCEAKL